MLSGQPVLNLCPDLLEIDGLRMCQELKCGSFEQEYQPGGCTLWIKIRAEKMLLFALAQDLRQVGMPPLIQPLKGGVDHRIVPRTQGKFIHHNEHLWPFLQ